MSVTALRERPEHVPAPLAETEYASRLEPCAFVIFGATGDLARRKLLPALAALSRRGLLSERLALVGLARERLTTDEWRTRVGEAVREHARDGRAGEAWRRLTERAYYMPADFDDEHPYRKLAGMLARVDQEHGTEGNRLYYLAAPPSTFAPIARHLGDHLDRHGWIRLVVEKPFGHDLVSARALNELLHRRFAESEIFRIDHYLGKETVQNLLVLRFANGIFEPLWNRQLVDHVQITVAEAIGIEGRAEYYEQAGAIRDIFQNHLLQLLALTAMEPPIDFSPEQVRNEKAKVLRATRTPGPKHVVRGQYGHGFVDGEEVAGYREEPGVPARSMTDTYIAAKLFVDNWRWADTPFYLRTGKRLAQRATRVTVQFNRAPHPPFRNLPVEQLRPNALTVRVQPDEGVSLEMVAKVPGQGMNVRPVQMDFPYGGAFRSDLPDAYERLIVDAMLGDPTLFPRADEVEEQWALVDAIVAGWRRDRPSFPNYPAGSWGPPAADELLRRDGRSWRNP